MKPLLAFLLLASALTVGAQTANVIVLAPEDSAKAKLVYEAMEKAKADWEAEKVDIKAKYGRKGFEEFEFSKDFKAIVPATIFTGMSSGTICSNCWTVPTCAGSACGCACTGVNICGCQ
jgi:hypothetical protein